MFESTPLLRLKLVDLGESFSLELLLHEDVGVGIAVGILPFALGVFVTVTRADGIPRAIILLIGKDRDVNGTAGTVPHGLGALRRGDRSFSDGSIGHRKGWKETKEDEVTRDKEEDKRKTGAQKNPA